MESSEHPSSSQNEIKAEKKFENFKKFYKLTQITRIHSLQVFKSSYVFNHFWVDFNFYDCSERNTFSGSNSEKSILFVQDRQYSYGRKHTNYFFLQIFEHLSTNSDKSQRLKK